MRKGTLIVEGIIKEALVTLRAGGPMAIMIAVVLGAVGFTYLSSRLIEQIHRLAPVIAAWRGQPAPKPVECSSPAPLPPPHPPGELQIDDEAAIEFGTALCSACEVAAIAIDYDHRIRLYNDGAEALTGWPHEAVMGQDLAAIIPAEDARHHAGFVRAYLDRYRAGGPRLAGDMRQIRIRRRDGAVIAVRARLIHINRGSQVIFAWLSPAEVES